MRIIYCGALGSGRLIPADTISWPVIYWGTNLCFNSQKEKLLADGEIGVWTAIAGKSFQTI